MAVKRMGDLPLGSVIQLPETGVPTDFIVAMHDYRSADNGIGKTLLIRDTNLGERTWTTDASGYLSSTTDYTYAESLLAQWYANTYLPTLGDVADLVETVKIGSTGSFKVFAPGLNEFNFSASSTTPTGVIDQLVRYRIWSNRMGQSYWTWDTAKNGDDYYTEAYYITVGSTGTVTYTSKAMNSANYVMVCLCVSADCVVGEDGLLRKNHAPQLLSNYFGTGSVTTKRSPFKLLYQIKDEDGDSLEVTESIDGAVHRTFTGFSDQKCWFDLLKETFDGLEAEADHVLTVTVTDGSDTVSKSYTFFKSIDSGYRVFVGAIAGKGNGYCWTKRELLHDAADENDRFVLEPELTLEKNDAGSFSFKVPVTNPARALLQLKKAVVSVEEDGRELWCGYVTEMTPDYDLNLEIYCDGELNYLQDMPCRVENKVYTVNEMMNLITTCPDSRFVTEGKRFLKGTVTVTKPDDKKDDKDETSYTTCLDAAATCLTDKFDGILRLRKVIKMENGVKVYYRYLDYLSDVPDITEQTIEFGSNLLDISYYMKAYSIVNSVKAYGYTTSGWWIWEKTKPIEVTVNNEKSIELYGLSQRCIVVDGKKSDTNSLTKAAKTELDKQDSGLSGGIDINAGDLVDAGVDVDRLAFLKKTRVKSEPHGIDDWVLCTKEVIPLDALDQKKFTFGDTAENITASLAAGVGTAGKAWNAIQSTIGYIKNS